MITLCLLKMYDSMDLRTFENVLVYPFQKQEILDSSKVKEFADDYFKFDENGLKLSKCIENNAGKGELLVKSNFSFSHSVFKRLV